MYLKVIETSQTWTCPKTGTYLITCVGGGGGGGGDSGNGGVTSFGTHLATTVGERPAQGTGFTVTNGAIVATIVGTDRTTSTHLGYGYGGTYSIFFGTGLAGTGGNNTSGVAGAIVTETIDLTIDDEIVCTIGSGGDSGSSNGTAGGDGVIVIRGV